MTYIDRYAIKPNQTKPKLFLWFGLVWLYGISAFVDYLMPNPVYTYILKIYDL